ncbi:hypothetical protein [Modicisalibacter luteus]
MAELREIATRLVGLKARLSARGVPASVLEMPVMGFDYLDEKLRSWGLV